MMGTILENLTWQEAEEVLAKDTVVVIPLGAAAKEHGPHLKLNNDWTIAEYLKRRIAERCEVVIAPIVNYHHYPAFIEYPGSVSLRPDTARDLIVDICRSLARHGPHRFYVLNTGVSTIGPLRQAAEILAAAGIRLHYTNLIQILEPVISTISVQEGGTHADEIETSIMLHIAPQSVDMSKAERDYHPSAEGGLTRNRKGRGSYSPTGVFGDATLATRAKGQLIVEELVKAVIEDIEKLRGCR